MLGLPSFGHVCWHCRGGALFYLLFVVSVSGPAVVGGVCWAGPGFRVGAR